MRNGTTYSISLTKKVLFNSILFILAKLNIGSLSDFPFWSLLWIYVGNKGLQNLSCGPGTPVNFNISLVKHFSPLSM